MLMHIKAHLAQFPEHVAVQLYFKNAFCTLDRQTCLEVVSGLLGIPSQLGFKASFQHVDQTGTPITSGGGRCILYLRWHSHKVTP